MTSFNVMNCSVNENSRFSMIIGARWSSCWNTSSSLRVHVGPMRGLIRRKAFLDCIESAVFYHRFRRRIWKRTTVLLDNLKGYCKLGSHVEALMYITSHRRNARSALKSLRLPLMMTIILEQWHDQSARQQSWKSIWGQQPLTSECNQWRWLVTQCPLPQWRRAFPPHSTRMIPLSPYPLYRALSQASPASPRYRTTRIFSPSSIFDINHFS